MTTATLPKTTALFSWYGSNRLLAHEVGAALDGCSFVAVPFAGGFCELLHIGARTMLVNDLHSAAINAARVAADAVLGPKMYRELRRMAFHPGALENAQDRCAMRASNKSGLFDSEVGDDFQWAADYFVVSWMGRGGNSGTPQEFTGGISTRWDAGGGDSNARFRSAVSGLVAWRKVLQRCNFTCMDFRAFLARVKNEDGTGIYADPPFPAGGEKYRHSFCEQDHRELAALLGAYRQSRVVIRYYRHPLIEQLYPADQWEWRDIRGGRKQTNAEGPEVLIENRS